LQDGLRDRVSFRRQQEKAPSEEAQNRSSSAAVLNALGHFLSCLNVSLVLPERFRNPLTSFDFVPSRERHLISDVNHRCLPVVVESADNLAGLLLNAACALFALHQAGARRDATNCPIFSRLVLPQCFRSLYSYEVPFGKSLKSSAPDKIRTWDLCLRRQRVPECGTVMIISLAHRR
jgi:hypothetical protein